MRPPVICPSRLEGPWTGWVSTGLTWPARPASAACLLRGLDSVCSSVSRGFCARTSRDSVPDTPAVPLLSTGSPPLASPPALRKLD